MAFREIKPEELDFNPFQKIGKQWMLITAGNESGYNTMTASWGGAGVMWGKPSVTAYIRPQRYTKEFVDREETFTLSFYGEEYRKALNLFGTVSGKDRDKIKEAAERLGVGPCNLCENLEEAGKVCAEKANPGDAVLLSPACASWGQFDNYEQRGDMFKEYVRNL